MSRRAAAAVAAAAAALALGLLLAPGDDAPVDRRAPAPVAPVAPPAPPAPRVAAPLTPLEQTPAAAPEDEASSPSAPPPPVPSTPAAPHEAPPIARVQGPCPVEAGPFLDARGRPMTRARLGCDPAGDADPRHAPDAARHAPFEVALDDQGVPALDGLPPGRWTLHVLERLPGQPAGEELRGWVAEVEARPGVPVRVALDASAPRGRVQGLLRGAPREGLLQVELRPLDEPQAFRFAAARAVDPDGRFAFEAVPPGRYAVVASWDGGEAQGAVEVLAGDAPAWVDLQP